MDKRLDKRAANGSNYAGWAVLLARKGDAGGVTKLGKKGGDESARMRTIRSRVRITDSMRQEAAILETLDAYHSGFSTVEEYKQH
jgi:hypothetical protein